MIFLNFIQQLAVQSRVLQKLMVTHLVTPFPAFHGRFISMFTSLLFVTVLGKMSSVHALPPRFFMIHFKTVLLFMPISSKWSLPLKFTKQNFVCIYLSMHDASTAQLIHIDLKFQPYLIVCLILKVTICRYTKGYIIKPVFNFCFSGFDFGKGDSLYSRLV